MTSNRISMSLFDEELKSLINASAKIFPITQDMVTSNSNPDNYEYGRIERSIYRWNGVAWQYIIADDVEITWTDVQEKPMTFPPSTHMHVNDHAHSNKSIIDIITQTLIDTWNTVTGKADKSYVDTALGDKSDKSHTHDYASSTHNHDDSYYTELEIDTKLLNKSDSTHNHDGAYYKKSEITNLLNGKSDSTHTHVELHTHSNKSVLDKLKETTVNASYDLSDLQYVSDIRNGYTEGHLHNNFSLLETITQTLIDTWNSAVTHISDSIKHITSDERTLWNTVSSKSNNGHAHDERYYTETEITTLLSGKADSTTLSGHTGSTTVHVTQIDKNNWNAKLDANDVPPGFTIGTIKPTDGSLWYKEI